MMYMLFISWTLLFSSDRNPMKLSREKNKVCVHACVRACEVEEFIYESKGVLDFRKTLI